jgi:hypothetical protein
MELLGKIILIVSILWLLWQLMQFRRCVLHGLIIVPLSVSATGIFALCVVVVLVTGISSFHLIWMFLASYLVGTILLMFPWYLILLMNGLSLLTLTSRSYQENWEDDEDEYIDIPVKTRSKKRKSSSSKHRKHTKRKKRRRGK